MNRYRFKFRTVLTIFAVVVLLSIVASQFYIHYRTSKNISVEFQNDTISLFERNIVSMLSFPVAISDRARVDQIIRDVSKIDFVYYVEVFDRDGELLARAVNGIVPVEKGIPIITRTIPLTQEVLNDFEQFTKPNEQHTVVGEVILATTTYQSTTKFTQAMYQSAWVTLAICLLAFTVVFYFVLRIEKYVKTILGSLADISNQKYEKVSFNSKTKEFDDIAQGINQLSEKLSLTLNNLQASDKYKKMILDVISHELRQPINAIDPILKLLTNSEGIKELPSNTREHLRICAAASDQLIKVLDRVVDFSLINEGNIPVKDKRINPEALFDNIKNSNLAAIPKDVDFRVSYLGTDQPNEIISDEGRLIGVVSNLVSNALKFTNQGAVIVTWDIVRELEARSLVIEVTDTGIGISQDNIDHIFSDYYRGNSRKEGLGIGLSLVRAFVDDLGGEVDVDSKPGIGTRFKVVIPVTVCDRTDHRAHDCYDFTGMKAVVIDDNWSNCYSLRSVLEKLGVHAEAFIDPFEAIDEVYTNDYDVVFVDYWMPQMTGLQLSKKLAARDLFIVVVTAHVENNVIIEIEQSIRDGVINGYIRKPIAELYIVDVLNKVAANNDMVRRIIAEMKSSTSKE